MIQLLIMADDFTGALDTGVQFAACKIPTRVIVDLNVKMAGEGVDVLVVDTETRHLSAKEAGRIIENLTKRAMEAGIRFIYKKTDSALRGNIGAELSALLKASGCRQLPFLPAFPQMQRITKNGIHYVDGVPVTESPFGKDPFEPVIHADVAELIQEQSHVLVKKFPALRPELPMPDEEGILVFDAESEEELETAGRCLMEAKALSIMAGCAGFGAVLPKLLGLGENQDCPLPRLDSRLLVVCGSVNSITLAQLDWAEKSGFKRLRLTPRQKLEEGYWKSEESISARREIEEMLASNLCCVIETNDEGGNQPTADYGETLGIDLETMRVRIAGNLGDLVGSVIAGPFVGTLLITGGDTLLQCMNCIGIKELEPICEMEKGVVLARFIYQGCTRYVITKSGGFGSEKLLTDLAEKLGR